MARKLGRQKAHRVMLQRNLLTSLVLHRRIITTEAKAKLLQPVADHLLTIAQRSTDADKKRVGQYLLTPQAVTHLYKEIVPQLPAQKGSATRLIKTTTRHGDQAPRAALVIVQRPAPAKKVTKTTKTAKSKS